MSSVALSPDGHWLAVPGINEIEIYADRQGRLKKVQKLMGHSDRDDSVAFSPDGRRLASSSNDETIQIWEVEK